MLSVSSVALPSTRVSKADEPPFLDESEMDEILGFYDDLLEDLLEKYDLKKVVSKINDCYSAWLEGQR